MEKTLTIKAIATQTGLSDHTLRYYERIGLIKAIARNKSGHRYYSSLDIAWIEFLIRLRSTGMPIRNMQRFAQLRHKGDKTAGKRRTLLETHLIDVKKKSQNSKLAKKFYAIKLFITNHLRKNHEHTL